MTASFLRSELIRCTLLPCFSGARRFDSVAEEPPQVIGAHMSNIVPGSYVLHAKLPELGSGEVMSVDKGTLRVRFASSERSFVFDIVAPHLTVTVEGPAPRAASKERVRKPRAKAAPKSAAKPA